MLYINISCDIYIYSMPETINIENLGAIKIKDDKE